MPPSVLVEEQLTLDVKTGAKSKAARSDTSAGDAEGYGRPKVSYGIREKSHKGQMTSLFTLVGVEKAAWTAGYSRGPMIVNL